LGVEKKDENVYPLLKKCKEENSKKKKKGAAKKARTESSKRQQLKTRSRLEGIRFSSQPRNG